MVTLYLLFEILNHSSDSGVIKVILVPFRYFVELILNTKVHFQVRELIIIYYVLYKKSNISISHSINWFLIVF